MPIHTAPSRSSSTVSTGTPSEQAQCQARGGQRRIDRQDAATAAQPQRSVCVLGQAVAMERACRLSSCNRHEAFSVEPCRPRRGDGPQPVAPVFVAEPHRVGRQALGRGVGGEAAVVVAQQAGAVEIHSAPDSSCSRSLTVSLLNAGVFSASKVTKSMPSKRTRPPSVPSHR